MMMMMTSTTGGPNHDHNQHPQRHCTCRPLLFVGPVASQLWREGAYRAAAVVFFTRTDGGAVAKVLVAVEDSTIAEN